MPLNPNYATLAEGRTFLRITDLGDTADDSLISLGLGAASRAVDEATERQFGQQGSTVARYYTPRFSQAMGRWIADIDDLMTTTGLVVKADLDDDDVYEHTYATADYRLWPYNAAGDGEPWTRIVFGPLASTPPERPAAIEATLNPGWSAVPDTVKLATLIQMGRFYKRRDAPFGVAGSPDMGNQLRLLAKVDPDVAVMLEPYRRVDYV